MQNLDEVANQIIFRLNDHTGRLAAMVSEEAPDILSIPDRYPTGKYVLSFDPLDGSSNIDFNVSVGTIFAIHHRLSADGRGTLADCLQKGRDIVAAGYILYGSSTMLVYSAGHGVHGFTLDPQIGEFLLSHPDIHIPQKPRYFSANLGYQKNWSAGVRKFTGWLQGADGGPSLGLRYIGSMVADFHRTLLGGGVFYYPVNINDTNRPHGKLRLLYEVNPLAFLMEQAGGYASNGYHSTLDIKPTDLHHRSPVFIGNTELVRQAEKYIAEFGAPQG
ncbi:MAG: class 1 fructose-1,6-bisphosphatase [Anaerolineae bacterium]